MNSSTLTSDRSTVWKRLVATQSEQLAATASDISQAQHARSETTTPSRADVVIVGAGLAGLSTAFHLLCASPKKRVVVLESNTVGYGASSRNSGMLTPGVGQSLSALVKRYGANAARQMYATSLDAVEYLAELAKQQSMDVDLRMNGQLILARGRAGRNRLSRQAKLMRELALPVQRLDDTQLTQRLNLNLNAPGTGPAALRLPIAGVLNPVRLIAELAQAVISRGGEILEHSEVKSISPQGVDLATGGRIAAKQTVVATNAYNTTLNAQQGRLVPMHLKMLATRPLTEQELAPYGWQSREGVIDSRRVFNYFRLTEDRRLLFGGGLPRYRWGGSTRELCTETAETGTLSRELCELFPSLSKVEIEHCWTGAIAYALDTLPTIGPVAHQANVFHLDGWSGHGIALSVYFGRLMVALLEGNPPGGQVWFRQHSPRVPTEIGRWCGTRIGARAAQFLDQMA